MQLHIKALRNNSKRMFRALGADTGFDSMNDFAFAPMLGAFLNDMDEDDALPKTVLYSLNPGDNPMLASMAGNFAAPGIRSKVQFGTAWWFNDHKYGMESQLATLSSIGMLSTFIGMLTDSRSFLKIGYVFLYIFCIVSRFPKKGKTNEQRHCVTHHHSYLRHALSLLFGDGDFFHLAEPHPHEKYGRKRRQAGGTGVKAAGEL